MFFFTELMCSFCDVFMTKNNLGRPIIDLYIHFNNLRTLKNYFGY